MAAAVMVVVMVSAMMMGQSLAATAGCTSAMMSLMPCLSYSSTSAKDSSPSTKCCSALESVVKTSPRCLCDLVSGDPLPLGITVNQTRAMGLPGICRVETPPASKCSEIAADVPAAPPARSEPKTKASPPAGKTSEVPAQKTTPDEKSVAPTSPVPKGSKASQTTTSGGTTDTLSSSALFLSIVAIAAASFV